MMNMNVVSFNEPIIVNDNDTFSCFGNGTLQSPYIIDDGPRSERTLNGMVLQAMRNGVDDIWNRVPSKLKQDKEIILCAIKYVPKLLNDPAFLSFILTPSSAIELLQNIASWSNEILLCQFPELIVKAIELRPVGLHLLSRFVPDELFRTNRSVQQAWIRQRYPLVPILKMIVQTDRELALEVAQHSIYQFHHVGLVLRSDVKFMTEAIEKSGYVFICAMSAEITKSIPLTIRAYGNDHNPLQLSLSERKKRYLLSYVSKRLETTTSFVFHFVHGMDIASSPFYLPMLDQGIETNTSLKQLIAEFVGVPIGDELKCLQNASRNLKIREIDMLHVSRHETMSLMQTTSNNSVNRHNVNDYTSIVPNNELDVFITRRFGFYQSNTRFLDEVYLFQPEYEQAKTNLGKALIKNKLIRNVYNWGGRFLQYKHNFVYEPEIQCIEAYVRRFLGRRRY